MAQVVSKVLSKIERLFSRSRLSILKTIYFNFRTLPIRDAVKMPIYIYTGVYLFNISGKVIFRNCEVKRGMVRLGISIDLFYPKGKSLFVLSRNSQLIFAGRFFINPRFTIRVVDKGTLVFGDNVRVGSNVRICCQESVIIGGNTDITYNCEIMDSNFHYIMNREKHAVTRYTSPIQIGTSNWIGNNTQIMKGTKTKSNTMVGARSLLNKDYVTLYPNGDFATLAGIPAKLKSVGHQRVFSRKIQSDIEKYFAEHPDERCVRLSDEDVMRIADL